MAKVYRAEIDVDGSVFEVALKCLDPELAADRTFVRRFIDEARLGQLLRHVNIARTHEVGSIDNVHFIAFEFIPGVTLLRLFEHALDTQPAPVYITLRVIAQIARALAYTHTLRDEQGKPLQLVHRDVAPSNIIVANSGTAKLIDFGVAKATINHVRTVVGSVIGKLGYVAPEYLRTGKLDARADIYSLGVVLYEMLTARRLFDVDTLDDAERLRVSPIPPPSAINPHVPRELDQIVRQTLAPDPARRWASALDLYTALDNFAHEAGLAVGDADVAEWLHHEVEDMPAARTPTQGTEEIAIDIDAGVEQAFARVRARTEVS
jgi:serine/threonine-protein kinase